MHEINPTDGDRLIDWGKTSTDYATYRPGPPPEFYHRLLALGVGRPRQSIVDLGTGTGVLARQFARQGAKVCGIDVSAGQIEIAMRLARDEALDVDFRVGPAEVLPWPDKSFDVATANQCWLYFDKGQMIEQLRSKLKSDGLLVTSHLSWLPREDEIARQTEELVLQFNPDWSAADWPGTIPPLPRWAERDFEVRAMFFYDERIPFTRSSWRGRIRACRGVGATMTAEQVAEFDAAHNELLQRITPEKFTILHRIDAHLFAFKA